MSSRNTRLGTPPRLVLADRRHAPRRRVSCAYRADVTREKLAKFLDAGILTFINLTEESEPLAKYDGLLRELSEERRSRPGTSGHIRFSVRDGCIPATRQGFRNLFWRPVDGSGDEERLTTNPDVSQTPTSASTDGHWLLFNEQEAGGGGIWVMRLDGDRTPRRRFATPAGESDGQFSPDGKWVAYQAAVSTRQEINVRPFPGLGRGVRCPPMAAPSRCGRATAASCSSRAAPG
jgi:hypothetical protein